MITGRTRVLAVIGDPIDAARAPQALNAAASAIGLDAVAVPVGVSPEALGSFVYAARGWSNLAGLVVTMPHKAAIADLVDELSDRARASGAVNVVRRTESGKLIGDQIDGYGFVASLHRDGLAVSGTRITLFGAGGVARSIAFSLAAESPTRICIVNRSEDRASALVRDLTAEFADVEVVTGTTDDARTADLVINATSVGSAVNPGLPVRPELIAPGAVVADVIANPEETELLVSARRRGHRIHSGVRMQKAQMDRLLALLQDTQQTLLQDRSIQ